jgi:hypothetical protein
MQICAGFLSFACICIAVGEPVIKKGGWDPIGMPVSSQDLDFQGHMSWSFLCSVSSVKMSDECSLSANSGTTIFTSFVFLVTYINKTKYKCHASSIMSHKAVLIHYFFQIVITES